MKGSQAVVVCWGSTFTHFDVWKDFMCDVGGEESFRERCLADGLQLSPRSQHQTNSCRLR